MVKKCVNVLCLGAALWLVASCSTDEVRSPVALYPGSPEGHGALLQGMLEMEGSCLYIRGEGGERWLAAFPSPGTSWKPEDRSVVLGAKVLRIGAKGGFGGGESTSAGIAWVQAPDKECDASKVWLVNSLIDP